MRPRVSVVLPVRGEAALTAACLSYLARAADPRRTEVVLVENGGDEAVAGVVREARRTGLALRHVVLEGNEGFGHACNEGIRRAEGERICILNNDVLLPKGAIDRLEAHLASDDRAGAVGPLSNRVSGPQLDATARYRDEAGFQAHAGRLAREQRGRSFEVARLVGLTLLLRREVIERVGGFDPCFFLGNFEDDDLSLRIQRAGFRLLVARDVFVHHEGSRTFRAERIDWRRLMRENWGWFQWKWGFRGRLGEPYPARRLALARPFDPIRDSVPLDERDALRAAAKRPLPLGAQAAERTLLFADPGEEERWMRAAERWAGEAPADALLLVRAEPPLDEHVARVREGLERLDARHPERTLVLDATPLAPAERGRLYGAATEVQLSGAFRDPLHEREASAVGLAVRRAVGGSTLRSR